MKFQDFWCSVAFLEAKNDLKPNPMESNGFHLRCWTIWRNEVGKRERSGEPARSVDVFLQPSRS